MMNKMAYRPEIDGLRALAVLPVLLFHAGFSLFHGGFVGVDIFFVISGYLITGIIYSELSQDRFSIVQFYERRARRILPALFFVMLATTVFAWLWLAPEAMRDYAQSLIAVSTFSSNILFWRESGYFDTTAELKPLLHTWTLAVEEQFYIIFPILMLLLWRVGLTVLTSACLVLFVASLSLAQLGQMRDPVAAFFLLPTRFWELLVGALIPLLALHSRASATPRLVKELAALTGFLAILYSIFVFDEFTPYPSFYTLIPTLGTGLIICFAQEGTFVHRLLSHKALVSVGLVSYSAYLWHQPLFAFAKYRELESPSITLMIGLIFVTFLLAYVSWKYVEEPFRNKSRFDRKQIFTFAAVGGAFFIGIGIIGQLTGGGYWRSPPSHLHASFYDDLKVNVPFVGVEGNLCTSIKTSSMCKLVESTGKVILLVGDSHSQDMSDPIKKYGVAANLNIWQIVDPGCGYFTKMSSQDQLCNESAVRLRELIETGELDRIIFVGHLSTHMGNIDTEEAELVVDDIRSVLENAMEDGLKVTLLDSRPFLSHHLVTAAIANKLPQVAEKDFKHDALVVRQFYEPLEAKGATVIKQRELLLGLFCQAVDNCVYGMAGGRPLYRDSNHLSYYGSRLVSEEVIRLGGLD